MEDGSSRAGGGGGARNEGVTSARRPPRRRGGGGGRGGGGRQQAPDPPGVLSGGGGGGTPSATISISASAALHPSSGSVGSSGDGGGSRGGGRGGGGGKNSNKKGNRRSGGGARGGDRAEAGARGGRGATRRTGTGSSSQPLAAAPPPLQLKVTIRNLCDADRFGTSQQIVSMLRALVDQSNEAFQQQGSPANVPFSSSTSPLLGAVLTPGGGPSSSTLPQSRLVLDEESVHKLVEDEHAVLRAQEARQTKGTTTAAEDANDPSTDKEEVGAADAMDVDGTPDDQKAEPPGSSDPPQAAPAPATPAASSPPDDGGGAGGAAVATASSSSVGAAKGDPDGAGIVSVRILYSVPPKKTRRRGEKPGNVYLLLRLLPPNERSGPATTNADQRLADDMAQLKLTTAKAEPSDAPPLGRLGPKPRETIAQKKRVLSRVVEVMAQVASDDAKSSQLLGNIEVEESWSGKAWKSNLQSDRLVGTIWDTPDYKQFVDEQARLKDDLMNRPKPPPGGGGTGAGGNATAVSGSTNPTAATSSAPVAALVQHLLAKKAAATSQKKKSAGATAAAKKSSSRTSGASGGGPGSTDAAGEAKAKGKKSSGGGKGNDPGAASAASASTKKPRPRRPKKTKKVAPQSAAP